MKIMSKINFMEKLYFREYDRTSPVKSIAIIIISCPVAVGRSILKASQRPKKFKLLHLQCYYFKIS